MKNLNNTINQFDLNDMFGLPHTTIAEYILFKCIRNFTKNRAHTGP